MAKRSHSEPSMTTIKCTVVGDTCVGKTMLINTFVDFRGRKPQPTLVDNYTTTVLLKKRKVRINIWDIGGDVSNRKLRSLSYHQSDVFILCYAVNNLESFSDLYLWYDEIKQHSAPVILCGTKCDEAVEVLEEMAERLCKRWGFHGRLSCSAMYKINVRTVFEKAISAAGSPEPPKKKFFCC